MVNIELAVDQIIETTDPCVLVSVRPIPPLGASAYKIALVVETDDGRQSAPVELPLVNSSPIPD